MNERPRRGRQAEAERNDRLVLEAARDVFAAHGAGAPISAVAERAGVGMGSLYRRYGSKVELLQRLCVLAMEEAIAAAEEGLAEDDPWSGLAHYVKRCVAFRSGALAPLAGTIETTPAMWRTARRGRGLLEELVARAHRSGDLRDDVASLDIAFLIEQLGRRRADESTDGKAGVRDRLLAIALDGLRARDDAEPLPGAPPTAAQYEARWRAAAGRATAKRSASRPARGSAAG
jgi:AcrR family transcriptional regulator